MFLWLAHELFDLFFFFFFFENFWYNDNQMTILYQDVYLKASHV